MLGLDVVLKDTLARWWDSHKEGIVDWSQCRRTMQVRFGTDVENVEQKYIGVSDPTGHMEQCRNKWRSTSKDEWIHMC
jgi:hypothetical protein